MKFLNSNQLKIIAVISMFIDHMGLIFFPGNEVLRIIGRIAMPIFAYFIAEGAFYTKHKLRYFLTMFICGMVFNAVSSIAEGYYLRCVISSYSLSILAIYMLQYGLKKLNQGKIWNYLLAGLGIVLLFTGNFLLEYVCEIDYSFMLMMMPFFVYIFRNRLLKLLALGTFILLLIPLQTIGNIQHFALLSLILLFFYNGQRGKAKLKYFFYVFYPLHIAVMYLIDMLM